MRKLNDTEKEVINEAIGNKFGYNHRLIGGSVEETNDGDIYHLSIEQLHSNMEVAKSIGKVIKELTNAKAIYHFGQCIA